MQLPEYITKLLDEIAVEEGFDDYKIELAVGSNRGDNFLGVMTAVKLIGVQSKTGVPQTEILNLLCKTKPIDKYIEEGTLSTENFSREVYMYAKVLPLFLNFQREKGLSEPEGFTCFPKVYRMVCDTNKGHFVIIMEDLRPKHFQMWPKAEVMPFDHIRLVMKELGKLHAVSFALRDQKPDVFEEFVHLNDMALEMIKRGKFSVVFDKVIDRACECLENPKQKLIMQELRSNYMEMLAHTFSHETIGRFGVIGHGDCWNNNFLFKYEENVCTTNYLFVIILPATHLLCFHFSLRN